MSLFCAMTPTHALTRPATPALPAHFIWPHQGRYRESAQAIAQALFDALDDDLRPQVSVLCLSLDPSAPQLVCQEPAESELPSDAFAEVVADGLVLEATGLGPPVAKSADWMNPAQVRQRLENLGIRAALLQVLERLDAGATTQHFVGYPVRINGYMVFTLLRVQRKPLRSYPALKPDRFYTTGKPVANSLLAAAMYRFNEECYKSLNEPSPGAGFLFRPRDTEELLRAAGQSLLDTPALALGTDPALAQLFTTLNTISSLRYEGAEGIGRLLLVPRGHPNIEEVFALTCPTELSDYRAVRKLLEMTSHDVHLLADGEKVYALGRQTGHYDAAREDLFDIHFVTHYAWEFAHAGQVLLRSRYGLPNLPRPRLNRTRFKRDLKRTFDLHRTDKVALLWDVVLEASKQPKGTLLVITTEALAEADRLKLQCTLIEPVPLTPLITQLITSIDGAVLLDPDGYCYSIGVILDGKASGHGNGTRGARFNSAVRYVESSPYPCLVVVVSEDGMVDVLTKENLAETRE
ncbi:DNA integrity scanning protein DisA nucleotide-binding domain protein [Hymenobacter sp. BRD128]|uniref:DNA integrity scanning protein DisA nucleotide-binding domain protein n=1 Tax=Hymenobacter sp. BRD128 TaxID=2675878 RepID=UPI001563AA64|nr:DNA integrity scanning protein DisA nucleotide-binding domain protein [Hymenobacter sp. BRD128]QKG57707.1 DNA integrity scanning protein DisA nucleotide-binding domain protein [Hymenobacter sp. BRD128]